MQANTSIGEVVISAEIKGKARDILLRPSFYAINRIGSPEKIDEAIEDCFNYMKGDGSSLSFLSCLDVVRCCMCGSDENLFNDAFGCYVIGRDGNLKYCLGKIPPVDIVILANHLIKWGVMGSPSRRAKRKFSNDKTLFDPSEYVGAAMAHLGQGKDEAWQLTMSEFQRAIDAKYPEDPKKSPIPQDKLAALAERAKKAHDKLDPNRKSNRSKLAKRFAKR